MDASENNYSSYHGFKNKTWYVFRIRVTEKTITVWLDEEKKIEVYTENHRISIRMEMNRYKPFGIASWVSEGWVKSIRYRHLTDDEAHDIDAEADRQTRETKAQDRINPSYENRRIVAVFNELPCGKAVHGFRLVLFPITQPPGTNLSARAAAFKVAVNFSARPNSPRDS